MTEGERVRAVPAVTAAPPPDAAFGGHETVRASYTLAARDVRVAATRLSRHSIVTNGLGFALVLSGLFSVLANGDLLGILIGLVGVFFLSGDVAGLTTAFMVSRRPDLLREPVSLTATPAGLRTETSHMSGDATWTSYKRVRVVGPALVLELGTGPAVIIPTRVFEPGDLDRIRGWAVAAGVLDDSSPLWAYTLGFVLGLGFNVAIFAAVVVASNV